MAKYGYESGYGTDTADSAPEQSSGGYGYESNYGADASQPQQAPSNYSWSGLGQNAIQDIERNALGYAQQIKQGAFDIPMALAKTPTQLAHGTPYGQTEMGQQTAQFANQTPQVISDVAGVAQHPIDTMYQNPVTTAMTLGAVGSKALPLMQRGGTKMVSAALGPSQEAIEARIADPGAIQNASSYADLAHQLPDTLNQLKEQISQHAENAYGTLRDSLNPTEGAIPKSQVRGLVTDLVDELRTGGSLVGPARKGAVGNLNSVLEDINNIGGKEPYLSESHVKDILRSIDKNINWQDKGASETNSALTNLRGQLDQTLKTNNTEYAQAMQPVANKTGLLSALKKAFSLTNQTGEGLQPTDTTISKLQSLPTERKSITQDLANQLNETTGQNYIQKAKQYGFAKQFQGGAANGSRRVASFGGIGTALGAGIGKFVGEPTAGAITGEALGSGAGLLADKYGGSMAGALVDRYAPVYRGIERLTSSVPAQVERQTALMALLNQLYGQNASSQRSSQ